jgi:hypothetical protein
MEFEWDAVKAASNLDKHGVSFAEAMTVFGDPLEAAIPDPDHSLEEFRFLSMGRSGWGRILNGKGASASSARGRLRQPSGEDMSQGSTTDRTT